MFYKILDFFFDHPLQFAGVLLTAILVLLYFYPDAWPYAVASIVGGFISATIGSR